MSSSSATTSATFARLQENLRQGLTCLKDLWYYEAKDWVTSVHAADINRDGDIEVLAGSRDGRVCALSRDGRHPKWERPIGDKKAIEDKRAIGDKRWEVTAVAACPPSEQQKACVVASTYDGKIYVLNQQGEELPPPDAEESAPKHWFDVHQAINQMVMDISMPLTVVFACEDRCAYSFDIAQNRLRWRFSIPTGDPIGAVFTCDLNDDGLPETLIGSNDYTLYVLSSNGEPLASCQMDQAIYQLFAADIDHDGEIEILVGTRTKKLYALTPDLQQKWVYSLSSRPLAILVADVNDDHQSEILVSCDDQSLSILDHVGKLIWRQSLGKRYLSLNAFDLDRDGQLEILAGTDDWRVYALRVQLNKDLSKKIRRDYTALGKPDITTLVDLTKEQLELLLAVLGLPYGNIDKKLSLDAAIDQMEAGQITEALLTLLKLDQQKFQLIWEKERMGYRRALCLADLTGDKRREVIVGSQDGGLSIFNARGRLLWSEKSPDGGRIFDVQSGYIFPGHGEDLAFATDAGSIFALNADRTHLVTPLPFPERANCFYTLAPSPTSTPEILIGDKNGKAYLYTGNMEEPARTFDLPSTVTRVYASEPDEGGTYRNPELLISTSENVLFAYTRGGNRIWVYPTLARILALCAKDLDGDGRLEVLIGTKDRNIYVLDDEGNLRWRYVLYHEVLALETADIDNDGQQEILAGCADGILYVFTSVGDLTWRYGSKDPIQALRAADIDQDGNVEIVMFEENHLEVLQVVNRAELNKLTVTCWERLLADREPFDALFPLIKGNEPSLRAAGLAKLATFTPPPQETLNLLDEATRDAFTDVRKALPAALMQAYPADPPYAHQLLTTLFTDKVRDVRIEVVEHLELLARQDWDEIHSYMERALDSMERNTRRAGLRKISHLLRDFAVEIKSSQSVLGEYLFRLLLAAARDDISTWVREEAGRVLADFLNLFKEDSLLYLYRLLASRLRAEALDRTAYNLTSSTIRQIVVKLLALKFNLRHSNITDVLSEVTLALKKLSQPEYAYSTDLWLIYAELLELSRLTTIEDLASYEFRLKPEQFQTAIQPYPHTQPFLDVGNQLSTVMHPLRTYLRRLDPNDRLSYLLDSISALETLLRLVDRVYQASPLPGAPQPHQPEFIVLKELIARWQEMFRTERNDLRGHPEIVCDLQSRTVHFEETVGIWLQVSNSGRAPARNVKVSLLSDESFTTFRLPYVMEVDSLPPAQEENVEFLIKPATDSVTLTFEVTYDDTEHISHTISPYQERLDFIERPKSFTVIRNPYTTGTPLHDGSMCYGREDPLTYLHDNLTLTTAQTVLVLWGQRRSGKTTLLNQLVRTEQLAPHVAVMIDLQNLVYDVNLSKFFFKISYDIYKAMNKKGLPVPAPQKLDFYDESPSADPLFAFERYLDTVETFLGRRQLILLLDEFEELESMVKSGDLKPEIFKYLRSLMQERYYIHFLLSGTQQIEKLTRNYWSVFFNIARHFRLPRKISPEGAEELITKPVADFLEYEPQVVAKIRSLTADEPYLIHLVCRALIDHCNKMKKNYATINDVNLVQHSVLESGLVHFKWLWDRCEQPQQLLLQIIAAGAKDDRRQLDLDDIEKVYEEYGYDYESDEVTASLKILWAEDIIATNSELQEEAVSDGARYSLANGLFSQWLRDQNPLKRLKQAQKQLTQSIEDHSNGRYDLPPDSLAVYAQKT